MEPSGSVTACSGPFCRKGAFPAFLVGQDDPKLHRLLPKNTQNLVQSETDMNRYRGILIVCATLFLASPFPGWAEQTADASAALHVLAGASGALLVSAAAYPLVDSDSDRCDAVLVAGLGVGGAFVLGLAKELLDLGGWGDPQLSDLLLTLAGGVLAGAAVYALSTLQPAGEEGSLGISAVYGAFGLVLFLPVGEGLYRRAILSLRSRS